VVVLEVGYWAYDHKEYIEPARGLERMCEQSFTQPFQKLAALKAFPTMHDNALTEDRAACTDRPSIETFVADKVSIIR
jgi:hypothetical protein